MHRFSFPLCPSCLCGDVFGLEKGPIMWKNWRRRIITVLILAPLLAGGVLLMSGGSRGREALPPEAPSDRDPNAVPVAVAPVTIRPIQRTVEAVGTLTGFEEVVISAK